MTSLTEYLALARNHGFEDVSELSVATLKFLPEVRSMCAANTCRSFGKNWTCPPHSGTLDESSRKVAAFERGILVQTVGKLDDEFDYESMEAAQTLHNQRFHQLVDEVRRTVPGGSENKVLPMGAGACGLCEACTCPELPCRFPDKAIVSMEAYGLFVSQVCEANGLAYHHGPLTVTFTSCILTQFP